MNAHDLIKEAIAEKGKFDSVYWIACGGSMIDLIPAHELLQREATTFTSYIYTAREFDIMRPRRLGEKSLVIACSHSGNTPEVVEGCEIALAAGATVIAQTDNAGSKIDSGKWTTWVYPWGEGVSQAEVPAGISLSLAAELLDQQEGYADLADMYAGIAEMDKILPPAREKVNAELGDRFAKLCQEHEFFYILGSGPNFSQTYGFAICSLMEMQWQHCSYIHSAEYFHGPFEATQDGVFYASFSLVPASLWPSVPKLVDSKIIGSAYALIFWIQNIGLWLFPLLIGKVLDNTNPQVVQAIADKTMSAEEAAISYNYTAPLVMLASLGVAALVIGFILKALDKKKHLGLEEPNIKEPQDEILESEAATVEE